MDIANLKKILDKNPKSLLFAHLADVLRSADGDNTKDEALAVVNKGLGITSNFLPGKLARGRILFEKGDFTGARIDFEAVAEQDPFCLSAQKLLLETLVMLEQPPKTEIYAGILSILEPKTESDIKMQEIKKAGPNLMQPKATSAVPVLAQSENNVNKTELASISDALDSILEEDNEEVEMLNLLSQTFEKIFEKKVSLPKRKKPPSPATPSIDDLVREQLVDKGGVEIPDLTGDINSLLVNASSVDFESSTPAPQLEKAAPNIDDLIKEQLADKDGVDIPNLTGDMDSLLQETDSEILAQNPTQTLAELYISQGLPQKAVAVYKELLARDPGNIELQAKLALAEAQV
jgi:tetratricopeptide (TPR) repeat protein